jgi:DNA (cytosine-5)-methyltransferase 1
MKVGSLFAGIGGFDLGFLRAGFEVAWCVEFDKNAQAVLRARFPDAVIYGDIREVDETKLEPVDVICGGFPCQDVSVAGKRAGLAGQRTGLFYDAMRIVRAVNPSVLVLENVPGLLSSNHGRDFATVIREVGEGWDCSEVSWRVLDSQHYGVAQRRRRVFIVASVRVGDAEQILALSESVCGDPSTRRKTGQDSSVDLEGSPTAESQWWDGRDTASSLTTRCHEQYMPDKRNFSSVLVPYRKSRRAQSNTDCETWVDDGLANTLNGFDTGDTRTTHAVCAIQGNLIGRVEGGPQGVGVSVNSPMYTLTSTDIHAVALPAEMIVRRLTPVECERLQGFPDGWTDVGTPLKPTGDSSRYTQLGNAVTVNVAEWLARRTKEVLER